jgi:purine nucleosidase
LVIMGGACSARGNVTPAAEFNIRIDPDAAALVMDSEIPITMIPLDVTLQILTTPPRLAALHALGNRCGLAVAALLSSFEKNRRAQFGPRARALHDPSVIAYLLRPELYRGPDVRVVIETQDPSTLGKTVIDECGIAGRRPNVQLMQSVDADGFFDLLTERLRQLP